MPNLLFKLKIPPEAKDNQPIHAIEVYNLYIRDKEINYASSKIPQIKIRGCSTA